ncbi:MAG: TonB-dependent receptor [Flaviaesturariibacter sp.]|nr:TonB-dependent receptor [Flaviaesturariibacter sp.]
MLLGVFLYFALSAGAQEGTHTARIMGRVLDSATQTGLEYATLTLQADGKTISGATSDASGRFTIGELPAGNYQLVAEFLGYAPRTIGPLQVSKGALVDIKSIYLLRRQQTLANVTVSAQQRIIDNRIDKLVYNAERDITSQSGVATDVLRKVPQVSVDADGNVELAGSSGVRFLINGKPSAAFGSNIADVLQSIPASQIRSIEVVTNPGARYDAQGSAGIINIILKKSSAQGINGNLSLAAATRGQNGSFTFNARKGSFGLNAYVSGNRRPSVTTRFNSLRSSKDTAAHSSTLLTQAGETMITRNSYQTGIGFDWTLHERHQFTGNVSYDHFDTRNNGDVLLTQDTKMETPPLLPMYTEWRSEARNRFALHNVDADISYSLKFPKEDQLLEIAASTSTGTIRSQAGNEQFRIPGGSLFYGVSSTNPSTETESEVTADYTHPMGDDALLSFGAKWGGVDIESRSDVSRFEKSSGTYAANASLSNTLFYRQNVVAGYAEAALPVGELFEIKGGMRYEHTSIRSYFSNAQQQQATPPYSTVVPSLYLSRKIGDNQVVKLSYSKRINRPDYNDLNPFVNTSDPKNISAGNPYLKPEVGHRIEGSYTRTTKGGGTLTGTVFYRRNEQDIQPFIRYYPSLQVGDSLYTNVSVSMRENIGRENNTGVLLFGDLRLDPKLSLRTTLSGFHRHIVNQKDPGYDISSFNYRATLNLTWQLSQTLVAEAFGNLNSARNEAQGKYPAFASYSMAVRKQFWNKKASIGLSATNPFNRDLVQRTELFGPLFTTSTTRYVPFRSFGITFSWKFGRLEFKREKEEEPAAAPDAGGVGR